MTERVAQLARASESAVHLSVADILPIPPDAFAPIAHAGCTVARQTSQERTRHLVTIEAPLGRRALMDALFALAPYKAHGPDSFARVLDNWGLEDRARTSAPSLNLFDQHARALKSNWREFSRHRGLLMSALADRTEQTLVLPVLSWETTGDGRRRWHFDLQAGTTAADGVSAAGWRGPAGESIAAIPDTLMGLVAVVGLQPALARSWPAWRPLVKGAKSNYIGPASVPMMALLHRRAILNSRFIRVVEALQLEQEH